MKIDREGIIMTKWDKFKYNIPLIVYIIYFICVVVFIVSMLGGNIEFLTK